MIRTVIDSDKNDDGFSMVIDSDKNGGCRGVAAETDVPRSFLYSAPAC